MFLLTILCPVILLLSSNKIFGVFSSSLIYENSPYNQAIGGIYCIDSGYEPNVGYLGIASSYIAQNSFRDTLILMNIIRNIDINIDSVFIPGFKDYQDTGIINSITPLALCGGIKYLVNFRDIFLFRMEGYGGFENISTEYFKFIYNLGGNLTINFFPELSMGLKFVFPDFQAFYLDTAVLYKFWLFKTYLSLRGL